MSDVRITIDKYLYEVLKERAQQSFTVVQMRDSYLTKLPTAISPDDARKAIYRQLLRLVKAGVLTKHPKSNPQQSTYRVVNNFVRMDFKFTIPSHQRVYNDKNTTKTKRRSPPSRFEEQLRQYQVDLLSSIAESEEYKRLYTVNPELKALLEAQYHQARDKSSKLLGQIKAIKTVISHLSK
ncbi:hypothetical protein [Aliikangiella sp. IMCC44359]|uniref:hypothetical protein n=1 Tax=Aliikangiella sp. IMCC44359 TaxID=3459125 RepID=UPI00403ADD39